MRHEPELYPVTVATGVDYLGWKAIQLKRDKVELFLVPEIGGRIMGIRYCGWELSFVQPERQGIAPLVPERFELDQWRDELKFPLWGGGKTWLAPEHRFPGGTPYPDLDSGPYKFEIFSHNTDRIEVVLTSAICRDTRIQIRRRITMDCLEPFWVVEHRIENCGDDDWMGGIWDALMLKRPANVYLPVNEEGLHFFDDKGDSEIGKQSVSMDHEYPDCLKINCSKAPGFKVGAQLDTPWMVAQIADDMGYLRRFEMDEKAVYAHGWPAEVYNSSRYPYFTIESHSEEMSLIPGGVARFKVMEQVGDWDKFARKIRTGRIMNEYR